MKNFSIGWIFLLAILFSACGMHYNTEPSQRLLDQQGHFILVHPTDKQTTLVFDSVYIMSPTWWQAAEWAKEDGSYPWFWILLVAGPVAGFAIYYLTTRKEPARPWIFFVIVLVWGSIWVGSYCVLDSKRWSSDQQIPKVTYDSLMQSDHDLHAFWQKVKPL